MAANHQRTKRLHEFGPFRLDAGERLLLRDGEVVSLTPKAFELLLILVENPGHLLGKNELLKAVWPDSFVEEANLANTVSLIRKALGESGCGQRYIETVPKRGYRFVAEVQELRPASDPDSVPGQVEPHAGRIPPLMAPSTPKGIPGWVRPVILVTLGAMASAGGWLIAFRPPALPPLKVTPFTSLAGNEMQPSFSPEGKQIAFVWNSEQEDNPDIYVKQIDAGVPLRLTSNPAPEWNPVWSPDGRHIAFTREGRSSEGNGVYLIPALGGPERKLAEVARFPSYVMVRAGGLSFSPDGESLAVADRGTTTDPFSISLLSVETGEKQRLTSPPTGYVGDFSPAFSPDGKLLAFFRNTGGSGDLYVMPLNNGEPKRRTFNSGIILSLTWTADGREIVFSTVEGWFSDTNLWRIPAAGGNPERVEGFGPGALNPAISRQGNRLAFVQSLNDINVWRIRIADAVAGKAVPVKLLSSTYFDTNPQYSPDGQRIVFTSDRSGNLQIWVCESDGANPRQLTNFNYSHINTGTPSWSGDGKYIAFDSLAEGNRDVYVISAEGGKPRRLTMESSDDICPSWSRDGRWIYFGSNRSGSLQIWKMPVEGGQALQVTRHGGFEGFESPDGRLFYYTKGRAISGLWRIPIEGGEETFVLDHHQAGLWRSWVVVEHGIYFATAEAGSRSLIEFFSLATGEITRIAAPEKPVIKESRGMSISPDGQWMLYTQLDHSGSDIMLVENFH